jgi:hypothetical protein
MADELSTDSVDEVSEFIPYYIPNYLEELDSHFNVDYIKKIGFKEFLVELTDELLEDYDCVDEPHLDSALAYLLRRAFGVFDTRSASGECLACVALEERERQNRPKELSNFLRKLDSYDMKKIGSKGLLKFLESLLDKDLKHDYPYYINKHGGGVMAPIDSAVAKLLRKAVNLHDTIAATCSSCGKW